MVLQTEFKLPEYKRGIHLITDQIYRNLPELPEKGLLHLFIKHTSAALALNENADENVRHDLQAFIDRFSPENQTFFKHTEEGPDDMPAHIKAVFIGSSISLPITNKRLNLGRWQGIYLCEFRNNGGSRKLMATIIGQ